MSWPVVALPTSTVGVSAVTCTCSARPPTFSATVTVAVAPWRTTTFSLRAGTKPASSDVTT